MTECMCCFYNILCSEGQAVAPTKWVWWPSPDFVYTIVYTPSAPRGNLGPC